MQFQFDVSSGAVPKQATAGPSSADATGQLVVGLLQQMLDAQKQAHQEIVGLLREQLQHARAIHAENFARWKTILGRWEDEYPDLPAFCRRVYPLMEKSYLEMLNTLSQDLADQGEDAFSSEFAIQDFIDRNGMKLGQFAHLLSVIAPISEIGNQQAAAAAQEKDQDKK